MGWPRYLFILFFFLEIIFGINTFFDYSTGWAGETVYMYSSITTLRDVTVTTHTPIFFLPTSNVTLFTPSFPTGITALSFTGSATLVGSFTVYNNASLQALYNPTLEISPLQVIVQGVNVDVEDGGEFLLASNVVSVWNTTAYVRGVITLAGTTTMSGNLLGDNTLCTFFVCFYVCFVYIFLCTARDVCCMLMRVLLFCYT